eukprot:ANDGO_04947.mRNA.1 hypothetical protein
MSRVVVYWVSWMLFVSVFLASVSSAIEINPALKEIFDKLEGDKTVRGARLLVPTGSDLQKYPVVQKFMFDYGFSYNDLQILFHGTKPEFELYDQQGVFLERIDLSNIKSISEMHDILSAFGINRIDKKTEL